MSSKKSRKSSIDELRDIHATAEQAHTEAKKRLEATALDDFEAFEAAQATVAETAEALAVASANLQLAEEEEQKKRREAAERERNAKADSEQAAREERQARLDEKLSVLNGQQMTRWRKDAIAFVDTIAELDGRISDVFAEAAKLAQRVEMVRAAAAERGELPPTVEPLARGVLGVLINEELRRRGLDTSRIRSLAGGPGLNADVPARLDAALTKSGLKHHAQGMHGQIRRFWSDEMQLEALLDSPSTFLARLTRLKSAMAKGTNPAAAEAQVRDLVVQWHPSLSADDGKAVLDRRGEVLEQKRRQVAAMREEAAAYQDSHQRVTAEGRADAAANKLLEQEQLLEQDRARFEQLHGVSV